MKKPLKITLISVLAFVLLAVAGFSVYLAVRPKGQSRDEVDIKPSEQTYIDGNTKNIAECTPNECLFILASNLKKTTSYHTTIKGEVNAGGIYKQVISGEKFKNGGDSLYISSSKSALKSTADQIFIENDTVLVRHGNGNTGVYEDTAEKFTYGDYVKEYGTDFRELSNYELNEKNIVSGELLSAENGVYTFTYEINVQTGVDAYRVNMYKMGGLTELPTFTKSTLTVSMTADFMPISVTQIDEYSINMILTLSCVSTLTETFERIDDVSVNIPELEFFKSKM